MFGVKLKNSQIIADYLSCSILPKMSGLVQQTTRAFQTLISYSAGRVKPCQPMEELGTAVHFDPPGLGEPG